MTVYQIQAPNGQTYRIDGPAGATDAQVRARVLKQYPEASGKPVKPKGMDVKAEAKRLKSVRDKAGGGGILDLLTHGATFGLTDEAAGVGNMLTNAIQAPFRSDVDFEPAKAYAAGSAAEKMRLADARKKTGPLGTVGEIMAGVTSGGIGKAVSAAPTLLGRMAKGAKSALLPGAVSGFGYGEGAEGKVLSALAGAGVGATVGAALPVVGQVVSNRVGGLKRMMGRDPELPRRLVSEAMEADANTPRAVGGAMTAARKRGTPLMIADTGENTRSLLASVSRKPGASRTIARDAVITRQEGQADRIGSAITRDLGPVANPHQVADDLMQKARTTAAPLYGKAYSGPTPSPERITKLLARPSVRGAMSRAYRIAAEEGRDPTKLGFALDNAGEVTLTREPSMQTLDYVKRGMDDVIESFRDSTTGRLNLNTEGRAINNTLRSLLGEMDRANPTYAQARAAYGGPASGITAMNKGLKALSKGADDITAQTANMTPYEQEMYRLGVRRAMSDLVADKGDYADKVNALLGTPKKRQALHRLFGGRAEFQNFVDTLIDERTAGLTYKSVATGSQTAERMAADELTGDTGLAETAMDAALRGGKDGIWSSLVGALQKLREVDRFGAGQAGEATRESIAALLTETDPAVLRDLLDAAMRAQDRQAGLAAGATQRAIGGGTQAGRLSGAAIGSLTAQPVE
jgi:hypothetical protein